MALAEAPPAPADNGAGPRDADNYASVDTSKYTLFSQGAEAVGIDGAMFADGEGANSLPAVLTFRALPCAAACMEGNVSGSTCGAQRTLLEGLSPSHIGHSPDPASNQGRNAGSAQGSEVGR